MMLQKTMPYFTLWLLFQLFVEINCQMKPLMRGHHTATLINNNLYILGGAAYGTGGNPEKDFFYLDFSAAFNTQNLTWQDLSSINTVPPHGAATSFKGGANNSTLFLYGGYNTEMALVYTFDPQSNSW